MSRSRIRIAALTWAILVTVVGMGLLPARAVLAAPAMQTGTPTKQIIYLDINGQIIANNWVQSTLSLSPVVWQSGIYTGWNNLVTGDFNGDGHAEIVAASDLRLQAFYPLTNGNRLVDADLPANSNYYYTLLAAGPFQRIPGIVTGVYRDQLAVTYQYLDGNSVWHEVLKVYTLQNDGNWVPVRTIADFGYRLQAMAAGDVNRDGYADLTVLAKDNKQIYIFSGQDLASLLYAPPENSYCCNWNDVVVGNVDKDPNPPGLDQDHPGNEIVMSRQASSSAQHSELLSWYRGGDPADVNTLGTFEPADWWHYPSFPKLALGDLDGDAGGDMEVLMLRDPGDQNKAYLIDLNPSGPYMYPFEAYPDATGGYAGSAWYLLAAGDINGDGKAEVVILRGNTLRVFYQPNAGPGANVLYKDFPGNLWTAGGLAIADLGFNSSLQVTPTTLNFQGGQGDTLAWQSVNITSAGSVANLNWTASTTSTWIQLGAASGVTPANLSINVNTSSLPPGTYSGTVNINGTAGVAQQKVTVNVTILAPNLAASPTSVTMNFDATQFQQPRSQQLQVYNSTTGYSIGALVTLSNAVNELNQQWLFVDRTAGQSPFGVTISVNPQVAGVGTRTGYVSLTSTNYGGVIIPVTVNVADPGFYVAPTSMGFSFNKTNSTSSPPSQILTFRRPTVNGVSQPVGWTATAITVPVKLVQQAAAEGKLDVTPEGVRINGVLIPGVDWLNLSTDRGTTPSDVVVSINPAAVGNPGVYGALLTIVPNPFKQEWVRTVQVNLLVGNQTNSLYFPIVVK
jgi:hypothetical protein